MGWAVFAGKETRLSIKKNILGLPYLWSEFDSYSPNIKPVDQPPNIKTGVNYVP